jgi:predicted MFS family arabinose efflux permease
MAVANFAFGAAFAVFVLYVRDRLGLSAFGYGLFLEAITHLTLAATRQVWVAAAILVAFGAHAMVWGVTVGTVQQLATPNRLLGRVASLDSLLSTAGTAAGTLLGGLLADEFGLAAPFWVAGVIAAVVACCAWRPLAGATEVSSSTEASSEEKS